MTDKIQIDRTVVEQALTTLQMYGPSVVRFGLTFKHGQDAIDELRAALEQPQGEQEPVAWMKTWDSVGHARTGMKRVDLTPECETWLANMFPVITPLYTHPQPPRRPLTDEQVKAGLIDSIDFADQRERCAFSIGVRFAERAHKIEGEA